MSIIGEPVGGTNIRNYIKLLITVAKATYGDVKGEFNKKPIEVTRHSDHDSVLLDYYKQYTNKDRN